MLPLTFVINKGQSHSSVKYQIQRPGYGIYFTTEKAAFVFMRKNSEGNQEGLSLFLQFLNANPGVRIEGRYKEIGKVNYFIGSDPKIMVNQSTHVPRSCLSRPLAGCGPCLLRRKWKAQIRFCSPT